MIRYFELDKTNIRVQDEGHVVLNQEQQKEVNQLWSEIKSNNPNAFNDGVWTCLGFNENGSTLKLRFAQTDYATATWARRIGRPNGWTAGTAILVLEDDLVLFAERSAKVVADAGKVSMAAGGVLDTKTKVENGDFLGMVVRQMENELNEELVFERRGAVRLIGLAIGPGYKVEFLAVVDASGTRIRNKKEATGLTRIRRTHLTSYYRAISDRVELSTDWHLGYWTKRIEETAGVDFLRRT